MNAIQTKVMQTYEGFMTTHKVTDTQPLALNVLVRNKITGLTQEDCVFITKDGNSFMYGTQCVANIAEVLSLCSNVDFLPADFPNERAAYEDELAKYTETPEDETYYFPLNRFGFNIIDIFSINAFPAQDESNMIGSKEEVAGGVRYYAGHTEQGYVFKDLNAIATKKGICYIAECAWDDTDEDFVLLTPDNTYTKVYDGSVVTYDSAIAQVREMVRCYYPAFTVLGNLDLVYKFVSKITDYILQEVDWQCFSTMLNDMNLDEELDIFLADEFVEFAKKRIKEDNDGTDIDDTLADRLFGFLGENCFRNDDYSLTSWDDLLDKWEDEPNY